MTSEELLDLFKSNRLTEEHVGKIEQLIAAYPWFGPARFLKLKALHQLGRDADLSEINQTAVFSSDRGHLYRWIHDKLIDHPAGLPGSTGTELEFIEEGEEIPGWEDNELMLDEEETASEKSIPEKEEVDMEEPESEEQEAVPVIDPLEDEGEEPESEEQEADPVTDPLEDEGEELVTGVREERPSDSAREVKYPGDETGSHEETADETRGWDTSQEQSEKPVHRADHVSAGTANSKTSNRSNELIEQFLNNEPGVIKADKETSLEGDASERSVKEDDSFITDTLAKIYVKQGLHAKAIYAYERLCLKYPEKSAYFAAQIEKIKSNTNI